MSVAAGCRCARCPGRRRRVGGGPRRWTSGLGRSGVSSRTSRPGIPRICSRARSSPATVSASSSAPRTAAWRRAASSDAVSRALGLVDSDQGHASDRPRPLVDELVAAEVQDRGLGEAPAELVDRVENEVGTALQGALGQLVRERRCAPHASSTISGTPWECATSPSAGRRRRRRSTSARRSGRRPRRGVRSSAPASDSGAGSGRCQARSRAPAPRTAARARQGRSRRSPMEWTLRWATTSRPAWRSVRQVAWLPWTRR